MWGLACSESNLPCSSFSGDARLLKFSFACPSVPHRSTLSPSFPFYCPGATQELQFSNTSLIAPMPFDPTFTYSRHSPTVYQATSKPTHATVPSDPSVSLLSSLGSTRPDHACTPSSPVESSTATKLPHRVKARHWQRPSWRNRWIRV
jgi:hypothetical protein